MTNRGTGRPRYALADLPALLRTPLGRIQISAGAYYRAWPLLFRVARLYRRTVARRVRVVAVVGSFGKTTTARAVAAVLGRTPCPSTSLNAFSYAAGAVLSLRPWDRIAVIEIGLGGYVAMTTYADMVRPDITVVTSVGSEPAILGGPEGIRHEKADMVRALRANGRAVLNGDDANVLWMRQHSPAPVVTFGFGPANDVRADDLTIDWPHGSRFLLHAGGAAQPVRLRLIGRTMVYPALAAIAVGLSEGIPLRDAVAAMEALPPTSGRLQTVRLATGAVLLRDDFKAPLETVEAALDVLGEVPAPRRIVVLGDVGELAGPPEPLCERLGERIAKIASKAIFVTDTNFSAYQRGAIRGGLPTGSVVHAERPSQVVALLREDLGPGTVVLIKGRYAQRLERIALAHSGSTVRCDISWCPAFTIACDACPMRERGWGDARVVMRPPAVQAPAGRTAPR